MVRADQMVALTATLCSAGATIFIRQGLRYGGIYAGLFINLVVGTVGFWTIVSLTGGIGHPSAAGWAFFVLAGLIGTAGGRLLRFVSIDKVGAPIAAALMNVSPLVSTVLAIVLLGESVTAPILVGTVVIVLGTILWNRLPGELVQDLFAVAHGVLLSAQSEVPGERVAGARRLTGATTAETRVLRCRL
jgi:drug/metabolite transporter (DMT)-like permease